MEITKSDPPNSKVINFWNIKHFYKYLQMLLIDCGILKCSPNGFVEVALINLITTKNLQ
jgi:hypothetical protein